MEKAHDFVDWNFVGYLFKRMGFGVKWKSWTRACVEETYSVLLNGTPIDPIEANRALDKVILFFCLFSLW